MKILYGVTGEGMGHAIRSKVVLDFLLREGHEVEIIASNRAASFLAEHFSEVHKIHGLHIVAEENRVRKGKTLWSNVREGIKNLPKQIDAYFNIIEDFKPGAVISDFESFSYLYARTHDVPVFSIDNQQVLNRCEIPPEVLEGERRDFEIVKAFVKAKLPFCDHYFIATFFEPPIRKKRTTLHAPILRPSILEATPTNGEHLLVYQTVGENTPLIEALSKLDRDVHIYGMRRDSKEDQREGNLVYRPFGEQSFIDDLASAHAVIASAGFTLMGECVFLGKPLLAVPLEGQFEQVFNARYLTHLGYGAEAETLNDEVVQSFMAQVPKFRETLVGFAHDANQSLFDALNARLDEAAAGLL
ncbi:MAG: MJ1255/VC2487 family glycosyltransferase [Polyangiales bacterium]